MVRSRFHIMVAAAAVLALPADISVAAEGSDASVLRGIVRAVARAQISTDIQSPVVELSVREGESFHAGQVLMRFDCARLMAEWDAAKATEQEMRLGFESADYLKRKGAGGSLDAGIAKARLDKAEADARAYAARAKDCSIVAPFDGRVTELGVERFETPPAGRPIIGIVDESSFEIDLIVPSAFLRWVQPGQKLSFAVDETGSTYDASVVRVGALVDPVSQTVKVTAGMTPGDHRVVSGMSGTAVFAAEALSQ